MPRGMDERFENPSGTADETDDETIPEATAEPSDVDQRASEATTKQATQDTSRSQDTESSHTTAAKDTDESLNICEDWDLATIYAEPEQSEDIEITFTRLKKQLKRDGYIFEKNKHFYHAIFEIAFDEYRGETKEKIRERVTQESTDDASSPLTVMNAVINCLSDHSPDVRVQYVRPTITEQSRARVAAPFVEIDNGSTSFTT
jgi:hypothetical protein